MRLTVAQRTGLLIVTALVGIGLMTALSAVLISRVFTGANFANANTQPSIVILHRIGASFRTARIEVEQQVECAALQDKKLLPQAAKQYQTARAALTAEFNHYEKDGCQGISCFADDRDRDYLDRMRLKWDQLDGQFTTVIAEVNAGLVQQAHVSLTAAAPTADQISQLIDEHIAYNVQLGNDAAAAAERTKKQAMLLSFLIAAITLLLVGLIGLFVTRTLLRQLGGEPAQAAEIAGSLALGNLGVRVRLNSGDTTSLMASMNTLVESMLRIAERADAIGAGDFDNNVELLSPDDRLGKAINNMTGLLRKSKAKDDRHNWLQQGSATLSAAMMGDYPLQRIAEIAVSVVGRYLSAGRGVLYIYRPEEQALDLLGSYMYTKDNHAGSRFKEGEGAIGQVARERKPIILSSPSAVAAPIQTGTTSAMPLYTYTWPLLREDELLGVLEVASFERFTDRKLEFLETASNIVASSLFVAEQRENIQKLLIVSETAEREARMQSERLQIINTQMEEQQQQLQQQSEELQQTNSQMEEQQQQLQQQSEELQQTNAQMEEQAQQLLQNNQDLRNTHEEVNAKAAQLEVSNHYKSEFLANMSHELRTPLNAIILLSKMMAENREGRLTAEDIKRAKVVHRSGEDLLRLINDVLDLSKVEAGRMDVNRSEIGSDSVAQDFRDLFDSTARERNLEFSVDDRLQDHFASDRDKLYQILRNLLSNAFKFTKAGQVSLSMERSAGDEVPIRFLVRDTGVGIAADRQQFIFEAFRQVDGSIAREFGGTGLGLTISLRLAELLGGTIQLHSVPGEGSEFCLCLPDLQTGEKPKQKPARPPTQLPLPAQVARPRKTDGVATQDDRLLLRADDRVILLIDDDPDFGAIVLEINKRLGYKTLLAATAAEGLNLLHTYRPAGILLDLGLPDMDGMELLHEIKSSSEFASIPVYVISARDRDSAQDRQQIVGYLQKPVDDEQIAGAEALLLSVRELAGAGLSETGLAEAGDVLVVSNGGIDADTVTAMFSARSRTATVRQATATELPAVLAEQPWRLLIVDLTGIPIDEAVQMAEVASQTQTALLFFGLHAISEEDEARLRRFSDSIIIKTPMAEKRLMLEMERFLRKVPEVSKSRDKFALQAESGRPLEGRRILVVDDDPRNLFVITAALEQSGAHVTNAVNGKKALELLARDEFDLMITDIMMPVMDGFQLIQAVRAGSRLSGLPIVTLTAKAMAQDREQALAAGSNDFLSKPVDYNVLVNLAALWSSKGA
jgi:signal transduction histidine kinase/CheY-like chemotaxis protein